jgi:hypothetical protein
VVMDLRNRSNDDVVRRVETALGVTVDPASEIRKRRSLGFRTDRNTWVRIEACPLDRLNLRGGSGVELAAAIPGVAMPRWLHGVSWLDYTRALMWRADETEFVDDAAIQRGGTLTITPHLTESWWNTFNASLDALAAHPTPRTATPTLTPLTQARLTSTIHTVFPGIETTVDEWATAHGDLGWANLTAPNCYFLDWEDWGTAPRGFDAAYLIGASLAVPTLVDRIYRQRQADLDSQSGQLCLLYMCAGFIDAQERSGPLLEPAKRLAHHTISNLRR